MCTSNDTNNFRLLSDVNGIRFRCEHDRKIIYADPESKNYGDGTTRTIINAIGYLQVILYVNYNDQKSHFVCFVLSGSLFTTKEILTMRSDDHILMFLFFCYVWFKQPVNSRSNYTTSTHTY
jgi:hypothetical protein